MKRSTLVITVVVALTTPNAYAITDGSGYQILVQMLKQVGLTKEQLGVLEQQMDQAREYQSQFEDYQAAFEEFKQLDEKRAQATEMIRNGDLDSAIRLTNRSLTTILNLTGLEEGNVRLEEILTERILELKNKQAISEDPSEIAIIESDIQALENQRAIEGLRVVAQNSLERMSKDESVDESIRVTAENTALLARLAVEEQQHRLNQQHARQQEALADIQDTLAVGDAFKQVSEISRWGGN